MRRIGEIGWSYGVTTVPSRRDNLLPQTLKSLAAAGFPNPHLFVDGVPPYEESSWKVAFSNLDLTIRSSPSVKTAGNWILSMYELYYRDPTADRYALFQDDFVTYKNLRLYLERCTYPQKGYWNLYTFPSNQTICPKKDGKQVTGWYLSNQFGRGAVALIFSREALVTLLSSPYLAMRPQDCHRGYKSIDGGIITAMKEKGWQEYVHNPSLVQHTGLVSSMSNKPHLQAVSFRGEEYDAMDLLKEV